MLEYLLVLHTGDKITRLACHEVEEEEKAPTRAMMVATLVALLVHVGVQVSAVASAVGGRAKSSSYDADIVLAVLSPVFYWALRLGKKLGPAVR